MQGCLATNNLDKKEKGFRCGDPNHLIGECPKPPRDKNLRAFVGGSWSDSGEEDDEKVNNKACLVAQTQNKICLGVDLEPDEWIKDIGCSKHMTGNRKLFSTYKAYNGGNIIFGSNLRGHANMRLIQLLASKELVRNLPKLKFDQYFCDACKMGKQAHASHKAKNVVSTTRFLELLRMDLFGPSAVGSYGGNRYTLVIVDDYSRKVKESLNVTFDKTPRPSKTSPLVDDDLDEEEAIKVTEKKNLENNIVDETLEIDEIVNIKESRNHPLENVIGNLYQRTLRSQAQNQSNFFYFISTIKPTNVNEALGDESWIVTMQEELNQFVANDILELVPQPRNMTIIETKWVFRNKSDENGIVSRNKARLVAQGYNQQEGIDYDKTYAPVARLESIRILLAYVCALDFKLFQMDVKSAFLNGFINEEVYMAQPTGFIDFEKPDHVYKLKKAFYAIKQAPKACVPSRGLYKTKPPSPRVIKSLIQIPRQGQETRTKNKKMIVVGENEILTREIQTHMKPWVDIIRENAICLGGHRDHVSACLCHMLYCIETSTPYNLAFFILKRMEKTRFKPKELLPYGMLLTRLFKHVMSVSPELAFDHYLSHDRAMHPLAPHYERKTRADRGMKRPHESNASSSSTTQNPPSSSLQIDVMIYDNDDESFQSNSLSHTQHISSSSNVVSRVHQNPPHENHDLNTLLSETITLQTQQRDAHRDGLRSIGQTLKNMMGGKWK
ncbi:retrovirus-related pol polyprotein from transposon TNT 1-94 [Tanacetum coccineum]